MGYLNSTICYLVGPIEHDEFFGVDWRMAAAKELEKINVHLYNPLDRPQWMKHIEPYIPPSKSREEILNRIRNCDDGSKYSKSQKFVRHVCLRYVNSCDFVLCYLPNAKTFGTTEELVIAYQARKPIITICPDDIPSLWVYDLIRDQYNFKSLNDALNFMKEINDGLIELDLLKWIFLRDYPKLKLEEEYDW